MEKMYRVLDGQRIEFVENFSSMLEVYHYMKDHEIKQVFQTGDRWKLWVGPDGQLYILLYDGREE